MEPENKNGEIKPIPITPKHVPIIQPHIALVETFAEDMASVIGGDTGSVVKKIIHSEEEQEKEKKNLSPQSKKNRFFVFSGVLLLVVALTASAFLFFRKDTNTVEVQPQFSPLIFNDQITPLDVTGLKPEEITQNVLNKINNTKVKGGEVDGIYPGEDKQTIGFRRFLTLIHSHLTLVSNTDFVSDSYLIGVVKNQITTDATTGTGFFMLMKMRSMTDIFESLRTWEPNMLSDLHGFLGIDINSTNNYLLTTNFVDGIVENKNARILYDKNNNVVLMYIFADNNSVFITDSQAAAHEIILRLASNQITP